MLHPNAQCEESSCSTISTYFSDFYFPKSCCVCFETLPRLFCRQNSIGFYSQGLEIDVFLRNDENAFFCLGLAYVWKCLP